MTFLEKEDIDIGHCLVAAFDGAAIKIGRWVVGEVVESEIGESVVLAVLASGWVHYHHFSVVEAESQWKGLLIFVRRETDPIFICDFPFSFFKL